MTSCNSRAIRFRSSATACDSRCSRFTRRCSALNAEQRRVNREHRESQAVAEERNRIARELHDVIGHSVSVMTVQASAVRRRLTPDQGVERKALETVEAVGREALAEMRRMVGVLRQVGDDGQPSALSAPPAEAGNGLLGMRERVAVYGGSLVARAQPEGGFELVATLPLEPA